MALFDLKNKKENAGKYAEEIKKPLADTAEKKSCAVLSIQDALRIMYCLMLADGNISEEEKGKLEEIGRTCDSYFDSYKAQLFEECDNAILPKTKRNIDLALCTPEEREEYYDHIHDYVGEILIGDNIHKSDGMQAKVLLWNLLAIANSEGDYSTNEKRFIRYFAMKTRIDNSVRMEMEHTFSTLIAIEREEVWLKSSDRPYRVIEERVNELQDRKNAIMQGVNALIKD